VSFEQKKVLGPDEPLTKIMMLVIAYKHVIDTDNILHLDILYQDVAYSLTQYPVLSCLSHTGSL